MKRLLIAVSLALVLPGCTPGAINSPGSVANATVLDEQSALGAELAYKAARIAMETAVDAGLIKGARATQVAALDNRAYAAVVAVRAAYRAGNASAYTTAAIEARRAVTGLLSAIKG